MILSLQDKYSFNGRVIALLYGAMHSLKDLFNDKEKVEEEEDDKRENKTAKFAKGEILSRFPRVKDFESFRKLSTISGWVDHWPMKAAETYKQGPLPLLRTENSKYLWWKNPVLPGHLYFDSIFLLEEVGLELVNTAPHVFSMCHLYNALLQTGRSFSRDSYLQESVVRSLTQKRLRRRTNGI